MKRYEVIMILNESLQDDTIEGVITSLRRELEAGGAVVQDVARMGRKTFAREMNGHKSGFYVVYQLTADPDKAYLLPSLFKLNEDVFRIQITVSVEADTQTTAGVA